MNVFDTVLERSLELSDSTLVSLRFGRVKALSGNTVTVTLAGVDIPGVACLSSYVPKAGDWAWLLQQGSLLVAIGSSKGTVNELEKKHA